MIFRHATAVAAAMLAGLIAAKADVAWVCSIIEDGQPQVTKYTVGKEAVTVTDWRSRLIEKYTGKGTDSAIASLRIVEDNAKGLIAVAAGAATEPGQLSDYSSRLLIINKHTGDMSDSVISARAVTVETKGTCTN